MNVSVIIPYRPNGPEREDAWARVERAWARWPCIVVDDGLEPFSRAASINLGVRMAGHGIVPDVYVIADADMLVDEQQVRAAVDLAAEAPGIVVAFERYAYLSAHGTQQVLGGYTGPWEPFIEFTYLKSVGGVFAISAETWRLTGGFDAEFRAWGLEDSAFEIAARTCAGPTRKVPGTGWHLWHPLEQNRPAENGDRLARYAAADGDPEAVRALVGA